MENKVGSAGETNLTVMLKSLTPELHEHEYVFCTVPSLSSSDLNEVVGVVKEEEGFTIIVRREYADASKLSYTSEMAWITLRIHSSLEAVGLTGAFSTALARAGISCNVLAGTYHDHIFVPSRDAEKAMRVLNALSEPEVQ